MSYYSAIDRRINADEWFRNLNRDEQWLWFRLLTGSHVTQVAGLWPATEDGLARSFRIPVKLFRKLFAKFEGRALADWDAGVIYLPNALKIEPNQPRNEATLKGWIPALELVPECRLRDRAIGDFVRWILSEPERFKNGVPSGFPRPKETVTPTVTVTVTETISETVTDTVEPTVDVTMPSRARTRARARPNQEQEQEHEQEQEPAAVVDPDTLIRCPCPLPIDDETLTGLKIDVGIPVDVASVALRDWARTQRADPNKLRAVGTWISYGIAAVRGRWSNSANWPAMKAAVNRPPEDTTSDEPAARQAALAAKVSPRKPLPPTPTDEGPPAGGISALIARAGGDGQ